jgi:hypothetical protein
MALLNIKQIIDLWKNEIRNLVLHKVSGGPASPVEGQIWYDTAAQHLKYENASVVVDPHDRATHTGSQTASTISDFTTAVRSNTLNQMAAPTADLDVNTHKVIGLVAGTATGHAVEFDQLAAAIATARTGMSYKDPVRAATTANIASLAGGAPNVLDTSVNLAVNDRVLVKDQSTGGQNGIYVVTTVGTGANGTWTRASDADTAAELQGGTLVPVDEGTVNADKVFMLTNDVVTIGTTAQVWTNPFSGATYTASLGAQLVGNDIRANLGTGMTLSGNQAVPDFGAGANKVMRGKIAVGFVPSGSVDATINHAMALANKDDYLLEIVEVGVGRVLCGEVSVDTNNVTVSFATAPTTNQYRYKFLGLS